MPDTAIIDTHLHLWDPGLIRYPWIEGNAILDRAYSLEDYDRYFAGVEVEAMVFLQCEAEPAAFLREAEWVAGLAEADPRIRGMVAWAPLEKGRAVEADLAALKRHSILRGVRRIIQFEDDIDFCLRPDFIEGVRTLADFGLSFDICIDHRHMANVIRFVEAVPEVPMILDHIGKPAIRDGQFQPWASQMRELARFDNLVCKVSGVATEAAPDWRPEDLQPFIETAFAEFGYGRTMFGGDWPVALMAIEPVRWVGLLDDMLRHASDEDRKRFWRDNAIRTYRLGL